MISDQINLFPNVLITVSNAMLIYSRILLCLQDFNDAIIFRITLLGKCDIGDMAGLNAIMYIFLKLYKETKQFNNR